jgi:collagen type IV alpha-3-binding protein
VTAAEMAEVFHNGKLKLEWDHTIEADKKLETLDEYCAVYHQILRRVWPTAQRDVVYASHKQKVIFSRDFLKVGRTP